jgi:DNA-directed RNA polymerase specialized sigma24 family protein
MYAYAPNGVVADLCAQVPEVHPDLAAQYREVPRSVADRIEPGWIVSGNSYTPPPVLDPVPGTVVTPPPTLTYKADLYRRATEDEAERIEEALAAAPVRQRRLFEAAQYLDHADPEFAAMHEALVGLFGEERADELLAAS